MKGIISYLFTVSFVAVFLFAFPATAGEVGKEIFLKYECISCHSISAYGMAMIKSEDAEDDDWGDEEEGEIVEPPDLSNVGAKRDKKFLSLFLRKKANIDGRMHKKRFKGSKEERKKLVIWLSTLTKPPIKLMGDKAK